jgi:hypothetical protein
MATTHKERVQAKRRQRDANLATRLEERGWLRPEKVEKLRAKALPDKDQTAATRTSTLTGWRRLLRTVLRLTAALAIVGVIAGGVSFIIRNNAKQAQDQADQMLSVLSETNSSIPAPISGGVSEDDAGPASAKVRAYLEAQNTLTAVDKLGSSSQRVLAREAAAAFVSPGLLRTVGVESLVGDPDWTPSRSQAASGVAPLSLAVAVSSGDLSFTADPACEWVDAPRPDGAKPAPTTLALCLGQNDEVHGWAELSWDGEGGDALISAVHVGWSSSHLRQTGGES